MEQALVDERCTHEMEHYAKTRQLEIERKVVQPFNILNFNPYFDGKGRRFSNGDGQDDGYHGEGYDGTQEGAALLREFGVPEGGRGTLGQGGIRQQDTLVGGLIVEPRAKGHIITRNKNRMLPASFYEGFRKDGGAKMVDGGTMAQYKIFQQVHPGYPPANAVFG
jgi:hypothetical protein